MKRFAAELVDLNCDCIVGQSTPVVAALKNATRTIPVVFIAVGDPIGSGFVDSLARPGGNVTGYTNLLPTITGKCLSILRELKSQLTRVAIMYNPESVPKGVAYYVPTFMESEKEFHIAVIAAEVRSSDEIETAMADLGAAPDSGLIVMPDNFTSFHRELIVSLAARLRFPPFIRIVILLMRGAYCPMALMSLICIDERPITSIASSKAPSLRIFPSKRRRNSSLSSI